MGTYHVCPSIASVTAGSCYFRSALLLLGSVFITPSSAAYRKCGWGGGKLRVQNVGGGEGIYDVFTFQKSRGGKNSPGGKELT